jgi:uncharacterized protein YndB with AHSA1/START domain
MSKPEFVYVIFIQSTPEAVWQALTEPEFIAKYWGGRRLESDWQVGSPVRHMRPDGGSFGEGKVLAADPSRLLSYSFHLRQSDGTLVEPPGHVTFEIEAAGSAVKLTLKHEHGDDSPRRQVMNNAWPAILSSLKSLLETGEPLSLHE